MPLQKMIGHHTTKQSYKEAIGCAVQDIYDRYEQPFLDVILVEVKQWPGNDSLDVQRLHDDLMDYDPEYNPDCFKSTDLKKMKHMYNLIDDLNHCQVTDTLSI